MMVCPLGLVSKAPPVGHSPVSFDLVCGGVEKKLSFIHLPPTKVQEASSQFSPFGFSGLMPLPVLLGVDSQAAVLEVSLLPPQRCFCRPIIAAKMSLELLCGPFGSAHLSVVRTSYIICGAKCSVKM